MGLLVCQILAKEQRIGSFRLEGVVLRLVSCKGGGLSGACNGVVERCVLA